MSAMPFVGDVLEKETTSFSPPSAPVLKSKDGFPRHTKRALPSRFKQNKQSSRSDNGSSTDRPSAAPQTEQEQIHSENKAVLDQMSSTEIEEAQQELLASLDTSLLQSFLKRANIDSGSNEATGDLQSIDLKTSPGTQRQKPSTREPKKVAFENHDDEEHAKVDSEPASIQAGLDQDSIHFPRAPQPPDLDPSSQTFLEDLHTKYFPSLPAEPDKLDWMRSSNDAKSSYRVGQDALNPRDIRFAFTGELIPPSTAAQIPVSKGLHHHGDAPDAAGYTIPELAHLSRSTYAPQRCIAFQTLGRLLYRLGKGEFGDPGEPGANRVGAEDTFGELARGLWREVETQHVIEQLVAESEGNGIDGGRHVSAKAYATEAVWLWRKGGGRRWNTD